MNELKGVWTKSILKLKHKPKMNKKDKTKTKYDKVNK